MKQVYKMNTLVHELLGEQSVAPTTRMRPMAFTFTTPIEDGTLLYHTMTKELLLLNEEELKVFFGGDGPAEMRDYLIRHWFLVPEEYDDCAVSDEIHEIADSLYEEEKTQKIVKYTIFTTTDCNARCYYCYEKGCKTITMTPETAQRVVDYILRTKADRQIVLEWFGGEPLFNSAAIEHICAGLRAAGCDYRSEMISNGYLFDLETVEKAVADWNLDWVQITLDGSEELYNRAKAYIYKDDPSPYRTVMENIKRLIDAGIEVSIRINASPKHLEDLDLLAEDISSALSGKQNWDVYVTHLFQYAAEYVRGNMPEYAQKLESTRQKLKSAGAVDTTLWKLDRRIRTYNCQADSDHAVVIMPDGSLTKCVHFDCGPRVGDLDSSPFDEEKFAVWKSRHPPLSECSQCFYYPICIRLKCCNSFRENICTPFVRDDLRKTTSQRLIRAYHERKTNGEL